MEPLRFDRDPRRKIAGSGKEGVSFEDAQPVLAEERLLVEDQEWPGGEDRFV